MNSNIERKLNEVLKAVGNISKRIDKLNEKLQNFDRRITKLEYLVEELMELKKPTRETTLQLVQDFMKRGLQIKGLSAIMLADYHRLPQRPVLKNGIKVNRSIIIKLTNSNNKRLIFGSLKNLKQFNNARKLNQQNSVYITEHLPKQFQLERKALLPAFKEAKALKKKQAGEQKMATTACI